MNFIAKTPSGFQPPTILLRFALWSVLREVRFTVPQIRLRFILFGGGNDLMQHMIMDIAKK